MFSVSRMSPAASERRLCESHSVIPIKHYKDSGSDLRKSDLGKSPSPDLVVHVIYYLKNKN